MNDETLHAAFESWETLSSTQEEVLAYEARLKHVLDQEAAIREAELRLQEAEREARLKGRQEGRQEGKQEGRQEGLQSTAERMLKEGFDIETVVRLSGLSREQVYELQQKMG